MKWVENDLTALTGGTPAAINETPLDGYSHADGSQHVNFIDSSGHVHELCKSPDPAAQWVDNDLTKLTGATPAFVNLGLDGYSQADGSQHVNFIGGSGHVHELYRSPDPAARWIDNDLTKLAGGTPAAVPGLDEYTQADGSQHVNFIDGEGHVHELYRNPDPAAQWVDNDLTKLAGGTPASTAFGGPQLDGYPGGGGSQHVNFIDGEGHVHELYRNPDPAAQWVDNDLTKLAGGTGAGPESGLDGYSQGDGSQHVNYIDGSHLREFFMGPDTGWLWGDYDLTELAGGTPPDSETALHGYSQGDGSQHVNYIDVNVHVRELYRRPDPAAHLGAQMSDNDLTALAGITTANPNPQNGLGGYSQSDGSQHVNYIDDNGHVHELYGSP